MIVTSLAKKKAGEISIFRFWQWLLTLNYMISVEENQQVIICVENPLKGVIYPVKYFFAEPSIYYLA